MRKPLVTETLTSEELRTLVRLGHKALGADQETRRQLQSFKINVVPANFYSDIPTVSEFENSFEFKFPDGPYNTASIFDPKALRDFLAVLDGYADEFMPPAEGSREKPSGYFWGNPAFSYSDAMAYYCMLRHVKPKHVLEVGSGFSTLVALAAIEKNGFGNLLCIEPYPMRLVIVFTWRRNLAERFLSEKKLRVRHLRKDAPEQEFEIKVNIEEMFQDCRNQMALRALMRELFDGHPCTGFVYEEILGKSNLRELNTLLDLPAPVIRLPGQKLDYRSAVKVTILNESEALAAYESRSAEFNRE